MSSHDVGMFCRSLDLFIMFTFNYICFLYDLNNSCFSSYKLCKFCCSNDHLFHATHGRFCRIRWLHECHDVCTCYQFAHTSWTPTLLLVHVNAGIYKEATFSLQKRLMGKLHNFPSHDIIFRNTKSQNLIKLLSCSCYNQATFPQISLAILDDQIVDPEIAVESEMKCAMHSNDKVQKHKIDTIQYKMRCSN